MNNYNSSLGFVNISNLANYLKRDNQILTWTVSVLITSICGALANVLLLLTLILHKPLRQSSSSSLIIHTVCLDLYICAFAVPVSAIPIYLGPRYELPWWVCRFQSLYIDVVYHTEIYAATMLAFHRLIATVSSRLFVRMTTKTAIVWMIALPWVIAMVNNLLPAVGRMGFRMVDNHSGGGCTFAYSGRGVTFALAYTVLGVYIPTAVMGASYALFLLKTCCHHSGPQKSSRVRRRRLELSRTMLILFVWHCVSLYPISIMVGVFPQLYLFASLEIQLAVKFLNYSCSAVNPVFCWCSSKLFQDGTLEVLREMRRFRCRQRRKGTVAPDFAGQDASVGVVTCGATSQRNDQMEPTVRNRH
ncbi:hypothetical protein BV898_03062 [Hypsibius exemplaris]|uniref:G-protein coupled receptors family 1 profile domain-containing protein n=1 Tax=Hypsibius exemplaris TaxID=2072580 RepID=A0A1W0X6S0_HYPEX|nr:hypothetical protein BV898_03062 [Hypsibius exemplaris]